MTGRFRSHRRSRAAVVLATFGAVLLAGLLAWAALLVIPACGIDFGPLGRLDACPHPDAVSAELVAEVEKSGPSAGPGQQSSAPSCRPPRLPASRTAPRYAGTRCRQMAGRGHLPARGMLVPGVRLQLPARRHRRNHGRGFVGNVFRRPWPWQPGSRVFGRRHLFRTGRSSLSRERPPQNRRSGRRRLLGLNLHLSAHHNMPSGARRRGRLPEPATGTWRYRQRCPHCPAHIALTKPWCGPLSVASPAGPVQQGLS